MPMDHSERPQPGFALGSAPATTEQATSAEFIMRVRVPIGSADKVQRLLQQFADGFPKGIIRLSRVERADYQTHSLHLRRKRVI